jgi:hypothetical protein
VFAGLSCYASARAGASGIALVRNAVVWAVLAVPVNVVLVGAASGLASLGGVSVARRLLTDGTWMLSSLVAVGCAARRRRSELATNAG